MLIGGQIRVWLSKHFVNSYQIGLALLDNMFSKQKQKKNTNY